MAKTTKKSQRAELIQEINKLESQIKSSWAISQANGGRPYANEDMFYSDNQKAHASIAVLNSEINRLTVASNNAWKNAKLDEYHNTEEYKEFYNKTKNEFDALKVEAITTVENFVEQNLSDKGFAIGPYVYNNYGHCQIDVINSKGKPTNQGFEISYGNNNHYDDKKHEWIDSFYLSFNISTSSRFFMDDESAVKFYITFGEMLKSQALKDLENDLKQICTKLLNIRTTINKIDDDFVENLM